jgi:hypothetical protein
MIIQRYYRQKKGSEKLSFYKKKFSSSKQQCRQRLFYLTSPFFLGKIFSQEEKTEGWTPSSDSSLLGKFFQITRHLFLTINLSPCVTTFTPKNPMLSPFVYLCIRFSHISPLFFCIF